MKTIIAGSRDIFDYTLISKAISDSEFSPMITQVVSGGANGVDYLGEKWASENKIPVKIFPADWKLYGKSGGYIRNGLMAKYAEALICVLWQSGSRGSENMITLAQKAGYKHIFIVRVLKPISI